MKILDRLLGRDPPAQGGAAGGKPPDATPPAGGAGGSGAGDSGAPNGGGDRDGDASQVTLSAIVRGIHHAAASTQNMLAQQYIALLHQFFDGAPAESQAGPAGTLVPKTVHVQLDQKHYSTLPLISLVAPRGIYLKSMKVSFSIRVEQTETLKATAEADNYEDERTRFKVVMSPRSSTPGQRDAQTTDVEVVFQAMPPAEGFMRLIDQYTHGINPRSKDSPPQIASLETIRHDDLAPPTGTAEAGGAGPAATPPAAP